MKTSPSSLYRVQDGHTWQGLPPGSVVCVRPDAVTEALRPIEDYQIHNVQVVEGMTR